jgi:tetratricopeptide (TPR) repeat protein
VLRSFIPGYDLPARVAATVWDLVAWNIGYGRDYALSLAHARDVVSELFLIGPLGVWCVPDLVWARRYGTARRSAVEVFMLILSTTYLVACMIAPDSNLGFARNWDLLAPAGFVFAVTAIVVLLRAGSVDGAYRALILACVIGLYHTAPWVAVNASEQRSLQRFALLPLGEGRTESTIGYWHALRGRPDEAERWLRRAAVGAPENVRARLFLGKLYHDQGRFRDATIEYEHAAALRPDLQQPHLGAAHAAMMGGELMAGLAHVDTLIAREPRRASLWALRAALLLRLKETELARVALTRAASLAPSEGVYSEALAQTYRPGPYDSLAVAYWERFHRMY